MNDLTYKQELFVFEYLKDLNGRYAYKRAYGDNLSDASADVCASRLLSNVKIKTAIETHTEKILNKLGISNEKILNELAKIGFSDITEFLSFDNESVIFRNSDEIDGTLISEVSSTQTANGKSIKMKLHDKMKALETLAKYKKLLNDNIDVNIKSEPIQIIFQEVERTDKD